MEIKYCNFNVCEDVGCKYFYIHEFRKADSTNIENNDGILMMELGYRNQYNNINITVKKMHSAIEPLVESINGEFVIPTCLLEDMNFCSIVPKGCPYKMEQMIMGQKGSNNE